MLRKTGFVQAQITYLK